MEDFNPPPSPYTEDILQDIYKEFEIPADKEAVIKLRLASASDSWHWQIYKTDKIEPPTDIAKMLLNIRKAADKLKHSIDDVPMSAWETLCSSYENPEQNPYAPDVKVGSHFRYYLSVPLDDPQRSNHDIELEELATVLGGLSGIVAAMGYQASRRKRGAPTDFKLQDWIRSAAQIWMMDLGREFTRDFTDDGQPISEAARFCVNAYSVLDPKTPPSRISNEMKKLIKFIRQWSLEEKRMEPE